MGPDKAAQSGLCLAVQGKKQHAAGIHIQTVDRAGLRIPLPLQKRRHRQPGCIAHRQAGRLFQGQHPAACKERRGQGGRHPGRQINRYMVTWGKRDILPRSAPIDLDLPLADQMACSLIFQVQLAQKRGLQRLTGRLLGKFFHMSPPQHPL